MKKHYGPRPRINKVYGEYVRRAKESGKLNEIDCIQEVIIRKHLKK